VDHDELCHAFSCVKVVVSFQKTLGMGEVEALACGKPIIGSSVGEMQRLLRDGEIGLVCEPNVPSYIEAIRTLSTNDVLLKRLSVNSRVKAVKSFNLKTCYEQWKFVISEVMGENTNHD
jgi:glycosyltransferase involved in cell wall biosynthesis